MRCFFATDGGIAIVLAVCVVLARKNSDDVPAYLCRVPFPTTHATDLIGAAHGFSSHLATALAIHAVALRVVCFFSASLATGPLVLFLFIVVLVVPAPSPIIAPTPLSTATGA